MVDVAVCSADICLVGCLQGTIYISRAPGSYLLDTGLWFQSRVNGGENTMRQFNWKILWLSYLHNGILGIFYAGKMTSLYWIRVLDVAGMVIQKARHQLLYGPIYPGMTKVSQNKGYSNYFLWLKVRSHLCTWPKCTLSTLLSGGKLITAVIHILSKMLWITALGIFFCWSNGLIECPTTSMLPLPSVNSLFKFRA